MLSKLILRLLSGLFIRWILRQTWGSFVEKSARTATLWQKLAIAWQLRQLRRIGGRQVRRVGFNSYPVYPVSLATLWSLAGMPIIHGGTDMSTDSGSDPVARLEAADRQHAALHQSDSRPSLADLDRQPHPLAHLRPAHRRATVGELDDGAHHLTHTRTPDRAAQLAQADQANAGRADANPLAQHEAGLEQWLGKRCTRCGHPRNEHFNNAGFSYNNLSCVGFVE